MKKKQSAKTNSAKTRGALARGEWDFDELPPGEVEACYLYEYGRELASQWPRMLRLLTGCKTYRNLSKKHPDGWKGLRTEFFIHKLLRRRLSASLKPRRVFA